MTPYQEKFVFLQRYEVIFHKYLWCRRSGVKPVTQVEISCLYIEARELLRNVIVSTHSALKVSKTALPATRAAPRAAKLLKTCRAVNDALEGDKGEDNAHMKNFFTFFQISEERVLVALFVFSTLQFRLPCNLDSLFV